MISKRHLEAVIEHEDCFSRCNEVFSVEYILCKIMMTDYIRKFYIKTNLWKEKTFREKSKVHSI